jgi:hypothetical protein
MGLTQYSHANPVSKGTISTVNPSTDVLCSTAVDRYYGITNAVMLTQAQVLHDHKPSQLAPNNCYLA